MKAASAALPFAPWLRVSVLSVFAPQAVGLARRRLGEPLWGQSPSDSILTILPVHMDFGCGIDGCAKRRFPIAFRVRRSRFPSLPWFGFLATGGGIVRIVRIAGSGPRRSLPRNARKPASRDTEGSLKNPPSDSILAILPPCMDFGRGTDGGAERKFPIAFRVRRSRFPSLPWFDFSATGGGIVRL